MTSVKQQPENEEIGQSYAPGYSAIPSSSAPPAYPTSRGFGDEEDDFRKFGTTVDQSDIEVRMNFVRKVYTILAMQLGLTTVVSSVFMYSADVKQWTQANPWALFVSFIGTIGMLIALMINRRKHPVNLYLLAGFTVMESYAIGSVVSVYDSQIVLQAVILTFALFIGLTLFTLQSKFNFDSWGPYLFSALWIILFASFVQIFLPYSKTFDLIISIVIAILFSCYIIYDTNQIFTRLSPEEYILAAVELYLDILNLFLAILRILGNSRD